MNTKGKSTRTLAIIITMTCGAMAVHIGEPLDWLPIVIIFIANAAIYVINFYKE